MFNLKLLSTIFVLISLVLLVSGCGLIIPNPDVCVVVDEICNDGFDNDCDDLIDCFDSDCVGDEFCVVDCNQESQFFTTDWSNFKYSDLSNLDTDVSKGNLVLENDVSDMVYAFSPTSFDGVWDMKVYDDKLFMAASTRPNGVDGGEIISYDYGTNIYSWEYDVFEQGVIQMEVYDGKIYIPGLDSLGSWSWGNLYIYDGISWVRKETVPKAVHIFGLAIDDDGVYVSARLYEGDELNYNSVVYKSTDDGDTWTEILRIEPDNSTYKRAFYALGSYQDKIYAQTDLKEPEGKALLTFDGTNSEQVSLPLLRVWNYGLFEEHNNKLYFFSRTDLYIFDGDTWTHHDVPFTGDVYARGIKFHDGIIYGGAKNGELYSSIDGTSWQVVATLDINHVDEEIEAIESYYGRLYVGTKDITSHGRVYVSAAKSSGYLVSETHDFGFPINSGTISWNALIPSEETSIKFQIRTANSHSELESLDFVGPDGSTGTYYEISGQALSSAHFGDSLVQYKVYFETSNSALAPVLQDVNISVSCADSSCVPIDEICDNGIDEDCDGEDLECEVHVVDEPYLGWVYNLDNLPEGDPRGANGALCPTLDWPPPVYEDDFYGADHNPTGEPIGGFFGYSRIVKPEDADYIVYDKEGFLSTLDSMQSGEIMYIDDDAVIDLYGVWGIHIPGGVTIASGRGRGFSQGALLKNYERKKQFTGDTSLLILDGPNIRITGLRIEGGDKNMMYAQHQAIHGNPQHEAPIYYYHVAATDGIQIKSSLIEVDNNEIFGWTHGGVYLNRGSPNDCIHHNYIHSNNRKGLGYGVSIGGSFENEPINSLIEGNLFKRTRHSIASTGNKYSSYEARYNVVLDELSSHAFDRHGNDVGYAGDYTIIHHNTFRHHDTGYYPSVTIRGVPYERNGSQTYNNWFYRDLLEDSFTVWIDGTNVPLPNVAEEVINWDTNIVVWNNHQGTTPVQGVNLPVVVAEFSNREITQGETISLDLSNSYDIDDDLTYVEVDFADNEGEEFPIYNYGLPTKTFTHTYEKPGIYSVRVRVYNDEGIFTEEYFKITVLPTDSSIDVLSFWVRDTLPDNIPSGYFVKEFLIGDEIIWSKDFSDDTKWEHVVLDVSEVSFVNGSNLTFRMRALRDFTPLEYSLDNVLDNPFHFFDLFVDDIYFTGGTIRKGDFETSDGSWESISEWDYRSSNADNYLWYAHGREDHGGRYSQTGIFSFLASHSGKVGGRLMTKYWMTFEEGEYAAFSTPIYK